MALEAQGDIRAIDITLDRHHHNILLELSPDAWASWSMQVAPALSQTAQHPWTYTAIAALLRVHYQILHDLPQKPRVLPPNHALDHILAALEHNRQQDRQETRARRRIQRQEEAEMAPRFPAHSLQHGQFMTRTPEHADEKSYNMPWDQ